MGLTLEHATKLFNRFDLAYSFNKSHAGVYGIHSCVNAYCKHNYFTEYMSAYMSMEMLKDDKKSNIDDLIMECRENGIKFLPPDINIATDEFIPMNSTEVMLPITFIKGMGEKAIETIIKHRPYTSVQDFKENCNGFFIKSSASGGGVSGVSSVSGRTGDVTLTKNDVGLSNVNNTSDLNKPISIAV